MARRREKQASRPGKSMLVRLCPPKGKMRADGRANAINSRRQKVAFSCEALQQFDEIVSRLIRKGVDHGPYYVWVNTSHAGWARSHRGIHHEAKAIQRVAHRQEIVQMMQDLGESVPGYLLGKSVRKQNVELKFGRDPARTREKTHHGKANSGLAKRGVERALSTSVNTAASKPPKPWYPNRPSLP